MRLTTSAPGNPWNVVSLETFSCVLLRERISNWPPSGTPAIALPSICNVVSLLAKRQVKGVVCGSDASHLTAPSSAVPLPLVVKVRVLSVRQTGSWPLMSKSTLPLEPRSKPALSNHQACCVSRVVLAVGSFLSSSSSLSQLKRAAIKRAALKSWYFIC